MSLRTVYLLATLAFTAGIGAATAHAETFYERSAEGWFWYERIPDPPEPVEATEPLMTAVFSGSEASAEPAPLSSAWVREQLPIWQDKAMDDPTGPAMMIHVLLERMAIAKAEAYKDHRMALTYSDPLLDTTAGMPTSTAGVKMARDAADDGQADILRELTRSTGLWFFYESTCPYCARQVFALEQLASRYGFTLYAISIDGRPLPNWRGDYVVDMGQSELLGVTRWPALFLVRPPDGYAHISTGLVSLPDLERRIVAVAHQQGWVSDAQWRRSRTAGDRLPRVLEASTLPDPSTLSDEQLLALLRGAVTSGFEDTP